MPAWSASGKPDFHAHMKEKADIWKPYLVILGKDFVVFEFHTAGERDVCHKNFKHYEEIYGYESYVGGREQMVVVKKGGN